MTQHRNAKHRSLACAAFTAALLASTSAFAESLPVFKVAPAANSDTAMKAYQEMFGAAPATRKGAQGVVAPIDGRVAKAVETGLKLDSSGKVLEVDRRSGHMFIADMDKLWRGEGAKLPGDGEVVRISEEFVRKLGLLPQDNYVTARMVGLSETATINDAPGAVKTVLDRQVNYGFDINVDGRAIPVVGGGGQIKVTIGDQGKIIGLMGGWRPIQGVAEKVEIVPAEKAIEKWKASAPGAKVSNVKASLAYYAAPGFEEQSVLAPVWVVTGETEIAGRPGPIRKQIIAATAQYGPTYPAAPKSDPRVFKPLDPIKRRLKQQGDDDGRGASLLDLVIPPAYAQSSRECGTSWIGESQGLGGSSGNSRGFVNQCRAQGWNVNFDWGDNNAWETDWRADDDSYVDAADLVFYTGHASPWGWNLANPDDGSLDNSEVGGASDLYGQQDLEWFIVAACGPHQSNHFVGSIDNAFDRWRATFDGLHAFMGYGAVTFDNTSEGNRFMELARSGWGLIDAWFRTAQEIQPATNGEPAPNGDTIFVTAMYAHNGDRCARNEKLPGFGPQCSDVRGAAQRRTLMWSGT